jgi:uncharacterized protein (TIGR02118 family)
MSYYLSTHMPLVDEKWRPQGLQSWSVIEYQPGPDGGKPDFAVAAILTFGSGEELQKAMASEGTKEVFADVPKFANVQPILLWGDVKGSN